MNSSNSTRIAAGVRQGVRSPRAGLPIGPTAWCGRNVAARRRPGASRTPAYAGHRRAAALTRAAWRVCLSRGIDRQHGTGGGECDGPSDERRVVGSRCRRPTAEDPSRTRTPPPPRRPGSAGGWWSSRAHPATAWRCGRRRRWRLPEHHRGERRARCRREQGRDPVRISPAAGQQHEGRRPSRRWPRWGRGRRARAS